MKYSCLKSYVFGFLLGFALCISMLPMHANGETIYNPDLQSGFEYNFRKTKWNMTQSEVEASEAVPPVTGGQLSKSDPNKTFILYADVEFMDIIPSQLAYAFYKDHLFSGQYVFATPVDIYQNLIRICEEHYGPYESVLYRERDDSTRLAWYLGDTNVYIASYPTFDEDGLYQYGLEFYDSTRMHNEVGTPITFEDYNPAFKAGPQYDFRKTRWLMTKEEVKASETDQIKEEGTFKNDEVAGDYIAYPERNVLEYPAILGYLFQEGKLTITSYLYASYADISADLLASYKETFGPYDYVTTDGHTGDTKYTWDLGKNILVFISRKEAGHYQCNVYFYYRMQLKEIPPK